MLHKPLRAAAAVLATAGALVIPAVAQAKTETVTSGGVTASFTYHKASLGYKNLSLTISRGGTVLYNAPVKAAGCGTLCWPGNLAGGKSVHVVDLEHNGGRDVVLDLFSGGANCCVIDQVFYPSGSTYKVATRYFGNASGALSDLRHNGHLEFRSGNPVFFGRFTDDAASGFPIQILTFRSGRFHDVTRSYPGLIAKDAKEWLKAFTHHYDDGEGLIAAWAADEYMLGRKKQANQYLNTQAKAGHLRSPITSLKGHKFVVALQKFLKKQGY
jgi:hypothetical protein